MSWATTKCAFQIGIEQRQIRPKSGDRSVQDIPVSVFTPGICTVVGRELQ